MLTKRQKETLAKHKVHHTAKHMAFMRKEMNKGKTFTQSHKTSNEKGRQMSLYANINKRKKAGTSRSKKKSTITKKAYANMKAGFPKSKKKKG